MLTVVLEGRRIAPGASRGRKVRTPSGAMLRNPSPFDWDTRRRQVGRPADGKCHRKLNRRRRKPSVRVKRCGKSAPREAQATRHGKPHRVQDQIGNPGAARSISAKADGFRVLVAKTNDSLRRKAQTKFGLQPFQNHFSLLMTLGRLLPPAQSNHSSFALLPLPWLPYFGGWALTSFGGCATGGFFL